MNSQDDLVSISDYAKQVGISKQAVSKSVDKLVTAGQLQTWRRGRNIVFSRSAYERAKNSQGDPARELAIDMARPDLPDTPPAIVPAPDDPYRQASAAEKSIKAQIAEIELQRLQGRLVEVHKVEKAQMHVALTVRNTVLAACGPAADRVAALPDPTDARAVKSIFLSSMKEALTALAEAMPKWTGAEDDRPPGDV